MDVGVDEAGKGPVLGPMVVAAVGVRADDTGSASPADTLPDGVADSKRLAPGRREALAAALRDDDRIQVGVAVVSVERIDDPATDMNSLTVAGHAEAIGSLAARSPDDATTRPPSDWRVLADAGDTSEARFARRLREACPPLPGIDESDRARTGGSRPGDGGRAIEARHGADDADPVVAAASIVAKVERDARVADIAAEYGDVGSGYPSDQTTRTFLREFVRDQGRLPACARESWQTCDDVLAAAEQSALGEF